jgi:hypothetical protein
MSLLKIEHYPIAKMRHYPRIGRIGGENIKTTKCIFSVAIGFSLLVVCFSGVHAEPVAETCDDDGQLGQRCGQDMGNNGNASGLGTRDDPSNWTHINNPFGLGTRDDPSSWNPGNNPFGLGTRDDPSAIGTNETGK